MDNNPNKDLPPHPKQNADGSYNFSGSGFWWKGNDGNSRTIGGNFGHEPELEVAPPPSSSVEESPAAPSAPGRN